MAKEARHKRMYKDSPKLERAESGDIKATKPSDKEGAPSESMRKADEIQSGDDGLKVTERHATERTSLKHKHMKEHMDMHSTHEVEHMTHKGDKSEMHVRHHEKLKNLHKEHEGEHKSMYSRHEKEVTHGEKKDQDIKEGHETGKDDGK